MNWVNIHTDTLRSEEYLGAEPVERATWLNLLAWCCSQENGGIIEGAKKWGERKWLQLCGITKEEATLVSKLYQFDNQGALVVTHYPLDKQEEVKHKREVAKTNGKLGGRPKKKKEETHVGSNVETQTEPTSKSVREGKGREWNGSAASVGTHTPENLFDSSISSDGELLPNALPNMAELKIKINSLRPEWEKPAMWNYAEDRFLADGAANQLLELTSEDWKGLKSFLNAPTASPKEYWRPNTRGKFCETFSDVFSAFQRWSKKGDSVTPTHRKYVSEL